MQYETALLVGGRFDGMQVETYPGQGTIAVSGPVGRDLYRLHRVHDSAGFHRIIGLLEGDHRGPMQALYEGYKKEKANA